VIARAKSYVGAPRSTKISNTRSPWRYDVAFDFALNWSEWSLARLEEAALDGPVLINDVVYAETSIR